jgi:hypothetical protein
MHHRKNLVLLIPAGVIGLSLLFLAACCDARYRPIKAEDNGSTQTIGQPGEGQALFDSDDQAAAALVDAAKARDKDAMHHVFGPASKELVSGDPVQDNNGFQSFATHAGERLRLEKKDANTSILYIGNQDWPFPIPLVRTASGKWFFDTAAGLQEILARRIGANELETIQVCRAYVEAQREYASKDRDGDGVLQYAPRLVSHPGTKDGLYWPADPSQEQSPFGPLAAQAAIEGYDNSKALVRQPYHGYHFHILTRQGSAAPGGAYNYVINGRMIAGFALVACPDQYGNSGVMTFIVSHQGKVYQKDLGPNTRKIVKKMTEYNPDATWTLVKD